MEDDWDLHAVVRGCTALTTTTTTTTTTATSSSSSSAAAYRKDCNLSTSAFNRDLFEPRRESFVHDIYKPFFPSIISHQESPSSSSSQAVFSPQSLPISPLSVLGGLQDLPPEQPHILMKQFPPQTQLRQKQPPFSVAKATHRSKRRKNNLKRVCHVAAENLSSDMWSWRKYGQKPIKGSPYPRGYYRCSTSKGCMARKQVERNRSDPGMFIVTYTAEHNHPMPTHRNSLAGSTRHKTETEAPNSDEPAKPSSPAPEKMESSRDDVADADEDDDDFSVSDMALDDDFFAGLEDFTAVDPSDGQFPATGQLPWFSNSATTIAGGGG